MDKNRIEGALDQAKGAVKEAIGKVTGNDKLEIEGGADKVAGKAKSAVGETKDTVRDAVKK
ncbi:MAG: CsbD family protein [Janthinobacterium lividum]